MTQMLSLLEEGMRSLLVERRLFVRRKATFPVNLPVGVSVPNDKIDPEAEEYPNPIMGRTRDLSETGLSFFLPSLYLGKELISATNFPLRIVLSLPDGIAFVQAETVRTEEIAASENETGFIVGARIKKINERDRKRYMALLRSLDKVIS